MTDREKIKIAQHDLQEIRRMTNKVDSLWQRYEELHSSLLGTGIDYSRDRVQTTPSNPMENIICDKLIELEMRVDQIIDSKDNRINSIYKLDDDQECNILIDVYVKYKSIREVAAEQYMSKSSAHRLLNKALTSYYNTNYCGNIE